MAEQFTPAAGAVKYLAPTRMQRRIRALRTFVLAKPLGAIGAVVIVLTIVLAMVGPLVEPYDPIEMNFLERLQAPSLSHWLGTDPFGRDVLSNIIGGARISIYVGFGAVLVGSGIGGTLGISSGYTGGKFDLISQRLVDILQSIPTLAFALVIVAALSPSLNNVALAISMASLSSSTRVVRSQAIAVRNMPYIEACICMGAGWRRIVFRHVLPNCVAPWIIVATAALGGAILAEASLSYLGVGVPPPHPSWGRMLSGLGREHLMDAPWLSLSPGLAIVVIVLAFNLFGDALRDILDPKLRGTGRK